MDRQEIGGGRGSDAPKADHDRGELGGQELDAVRELPHGEPG